MTPSVAQKYLQGSTRHLAPFFLVQQWRRASLIFIHDESSGVSKNTANILICIYACGMSTAEAVIVVCQGATVLSTNSNLSDWHGSTELTFLLYIFNWSLFYLAYVLLPSSWDMWSVAAFGSPRSVGGCMGQILPTYVAVLVVDRNQKSWRSQWKTTEGNNKRGKQVIFSAKSKQSIGNFNLDVVWWKINGDKQFD